MSVMHFLKCLLPSKDSVCFLLYRDPVIVEYGTSWHGFLFGLCWSGWNQRGARHCFQ